MVVVILIGSLCLLVAAILAAGGVDEVVPQTITALGVAILAFTWLPRSQDSDSPNKVSRDRARLKQNAAKHESARPFSALATQLIWQSASIATQYDASALIHTERFLERRGYAGELSEIPVPTPANVDALLTRIRKSLGVFERIELLANCAYVMLKNSASVPPVCQEHLLRIGDGLGLARKESRRVMQRHLPEREERRDDQPRAANFSAGASAHAVLGIRESANQGEIKRAFHMMAMRYHPDRVAQSEGAELAEAEARFKRIQQAYRELMP